MKKKYTHIINQAVLTAIVKYCDGSQTKLAEKLGMNRSYISKTLNTYCNTFPPYLIGKFRTTFPTIPLKQYAEQVTVKSDVRIFCRKLILEFIAKGEKK